MLTKASIKSDGGTRPYEVAATPKALGRCQVRQSKTLEDEQYDLGHVRLFWSREAFFVFGGQ